MEGAPNVVRIHRGGEVMIPEHLSKDQDIRLKAGDRVEVMTPGGGGYGDPFRREPDLVQRDAKGLLYAPRQRPSFWSFSERFRRDRHGRDAGARAPG